eukprot:m.27442 g.27442  ORF g.27442 m.27442 type:complete len:422 (-) comp8538_c0_seq1:261-1526(-)
MAKAPPVTALLGALLERCEASGVDPTAAADACLAGRGCFALEDLLTAVEQKDIEAAAFLDPWMADVKARATTGVGVHTASAPVLRAASLGDPEMTEFLLAHGWPGTQRCCVVAARCGSVRVLRCFRTHLVGPWADRDKPDVGHWQDDAPRYDVTARTEITESDGALGDGALGGGVGGGDRTLDISTLGSFPPASTKAMATATGGPVTAQSDCFGCRVHRQQQQQQRMSAGGGRRHRGGGHRPGSLLVMTTAASHGHENVVRFLHEECAFHWDAGTHALAAGGGHEAVVCYLYEHACPWSPWSVERAAAGGHVGVLQLLFRQGCDWDVLCTESAAAHGQLEALEFLQARGAPMDSSACYAASRNQHLPVLKFLHDSGCPWGPECYAHADPRLRHYLAKNGCPKPKKSRSRIGFCFCMAVSLF